MTGPCPETAARACGQAWAQPRAPAVDSHEQPGSRQRTRQTVHRSPGVTGRSRTALSPAETRAPAGPAALVHYPGRAQQLTNNRSISRKHHADHQGHPRRDSQAAQTVAGIVERRHTLPILANVLVRKQGDTGDLPRDRHRDPDPARPRRSARAGKTGATTVSARKLIDILRSLPEHRGGVSTSRARSSRSPPARAASRCRRSGPRNFPRWRSTSSSTRS